ncbi:MAG: M15 family metallopeptidase, partial [Bacteroidales bacterium]|nr:M15 family metallopeptidase [Bacteroidales bacterium]
QLSAHSFGIAIDINAAHLDYWLQDYGTRDEYTPIVYRNRLPIEIVDIFEQHGFIWGGKWYHYDTMHFEYRPELLMN